MTRNHRRPSRIALITIVLALVTLACNYSAAPESQSTQVAETVAAIQAATQSGTQVAELVATGMAGTMIAQGLEPPTALPAGTTPVPTGSNDMTPSPTLMPEPEDLGPEVDFNGDGFADLVVGVPGRDADGAFDSGGFYVFYGNPEGFHADRTTLWLPQDIDAEIGENSGFGNRTAAGDFDHDGFSDLAITWGSSSRSDGSGAVILMYGSADGLTTTRLEIWDQDARTIQGQRVSDGALDTSEPDDRFGSDLAAGDFNNDSFDDLAIGAYYEDLEGGENQGAVYILYGSSSGLTHVGSQMMTQNAFFNEVDGQAVEIGDLVASVEDNDRFGWPLAVGDLNGDRFDDLVIGVIFEAIGSINNAGALHVVFGSVDGLTPVNNQLLHENAFHVDTNGDGEPETSIDTALLSNAYPDGAFSRALAVGDFNGDGYDDLAASATGQPVTYEGTELQWASLVHIVPGSPQGLTLEGGQMWNQRLGIYWDGTPIPGTLAGTPPEAQDRFGRSLEAADFDADGYDDLVIGTQLEDLEQINSAGTVTVIYGTAAGLATERNQSFNQVAVESGGVVSEGLLSDAFDSEVFGTYFTHGDYDADGAMDLVVGAPLERAGDVDRAGGFFLIFGHPGSGLTAEGHQRWTEHGGTDNLGNTFGDLIGDPAENSFGSGLR